MVCTRRDDEARPSQPCRYYGCRRFCRRVPGRRFGPSMASRYRGTAISRIHHPYSRTITLLPNRPTACRCYRAACCCRRVLATGALATRRRGDAATAPTAPLPKRCRAAWPWSARSHPGRSRVTPRKTAHQVLLGADARGMVAVVGIPLSAQPGEAQADAARRRRDAHRPTRSHPRPMPDISV